MDPIERLKKMVGDLSGMSHEDFDHLQHLYKTSPAWERFGRIFAESILHAVMNNTEAILFKKYNTHFNPG
jgi:hypothetical protein